MLFVIYYCHPLWAIGEVVLGEGWGRRRKEEGPFPNSAFLWKGRHLYITSAPLRAIKGVGGDGGTIYIRQGGLSLPMTPLLTAPNTPPPTGLPAAAEEQVDGRVAGRRRRRHDVYIYIYIYIYIYYGSPCRSCC